MQISIIMFANDKESIDQGELLKMRRDFSWITDLIGKDKQYEVYYTGIKHFGTLLKILQAMGALLDPKIPIKYADLLKNDTNTLGSAVSPINCQVCWKLWKGQCK